MIEVTQKRDRNIALDGSTVTVTQQLPGSPGQERSCTKVYKKPTEGSLRMY